MTQLRWLTHTYLDDTTVSETIVKDTVSEMQLEVNALIDWSELNRMLTPGGRKLYH